MPSKLTNALFHIVPEAMLFAALGLAVRLLHAFARSSDGSGGTAYRVRLSADQNFQRLDWTFLGHCRRL